MKKFFISLIGAACFSVIMVGCSKQKGVEVAPTQQQEPTSVIDLMEKEEGVKYFKKDVVLRDASGKTEVVLRVASKDEDELSSYLKTYEFTVASVFEEGKNADKTAEKGKDSGSQSVAAGGMNVLTESISVKLEDKAIGYRLGVGLKKSAIAEIKRNGRVASYSSYAQHISEVWPELAKVTVQNEYSGGVNRIDIAIDQRWRWHYTWQPYYGWQTLATQAIDDYRVWFYGIDGPWKSRANVHYTPFYCNICTDGSIVGTGYIVEFLQL